MKIKNLNEDQLINLNYTLPSLLILILFIFNFEYFAIVYIESTIEIIKLYLFSSFLIFTYEFIRYKIKKRSVIKLTLYNMGLVNSFLIFVFLISNSLYSETIYKTQMNFDVYYEVNLKNYSIPIEYRKLYEADIFEQREFLNKGYILDIKVGKTFFGYKVVKEREFKDSKYL